MAEEKTPPDPRVDAPPSDNPTPVISPEPTKPPEPTVDERIAAAVAAAVGPLNEQIAKLSAPKPTETAPVDEPIVLNKDFAALYNLPNEAVQDIVRVVDGALRQKYVAEIHKTIQVREQVSELRKKFYESNQDLVGYEETVSALADQVAREFPTYTVEAAFKETAKRAKAQIKRIQDRSKANLPDNPPSVLPGGGIKPQDGGSNVQPDVPLTPEQEIQLELKSRGDRKAAALGGAK